jgi:hypothetical protein
MLLLLLLPATLLLAHSVGPALAHNIISHTLPYSPIGLVVQHCWCTWQDTAHQGQFPTAFGQLTHSQRHTVNAEPTLLHAHGHTIETSSHPFKHHNTAAGVT